MSFTEWHRLLRIKIGLDTWESYGEKKACICFLFETESPNSYLKSIGKICFSRMIKVRKYETNH